LEGFGFAFAEVGCEGQTIVGLLDEAQVGVETLEG